MTALERLAQRRSQAIPRLVRQLRCQEGLVHQSIQEIAGARVQVGSRWLVSFCSTNYLGLNRHPQVLRALARTANRWGSSLGMPRFLATDRLTARLERTIARLVGQEAALVFPSTTHIALDLLPLLSGSRGVLLLDEWAYPISVEGARLAARRGARILRFAHNDPRSLAHALQSVAGVRDKVVVCDGVYPAGGEPARLRDIIPLARASDAVVYVDDAHGMGVLGAGPTRERPYGSGGGGTPAYQALAPGRYTHVGSLSKAFGVPIAFVAAPKAFIDYLRAVAPTYTHSSPPALPIVSAALAVLDVHAREGDARRNRLLDRVRRFRKGLAVADLGELSDGLFPIQTLYLETPQAAQAAASKLRRLGLWAALQLGPHDHPGGGVIRFVLTAHHAKQDVEAAVVAISSVMRAGYRWQTLLKQQNQPVTPAI
jgi:8-amino-7-oxononanoate synthase